jgi:Protein of unknown function (DUF2815)
MVDHLFTMTSPVILAHPQLFEPKAFKPKGNRAVDPSTAKYSANFVIAPDHPDVQAMRHQILAVAQARWPGRDFTSGFAWPVGSGDKAADRRQEANRQAGKLGEDGVSGRDDGAYARGKLLLVARGKFAPGLAVIHNSAIVDLSTPALIATHRGQFFFGAEVLASVKFDAYDGVGANPDGVCAYLNSVLATGRGERIAGERSAATTFAGYAGKVTATDPLHGATRDSSMPF